MRSLFILSALAVCASAQVVSVGVRGGVPITDFFDTVRGNSAAFANNTDRWIVGPTVELHLPLGFSIEADALYRPLGYIYTQTGQTTSVSATAKSWQFPILAKWAFLPGPIKPFVDGGVSFQKITNFKQVTTPFTNPAALQNDPTAGITFGAGIQLKMGRVRIEPEFRYTRWGSEAIRDPITTLLKTNRNQGDFLIGITF